jgi:hypothetical protein
MGTLIKKNLVLKQRNPAQYSLTEEGEVLAKTLYANKDKTAQKLSLPKLSPRKRSPRKKAKATAAPNIPKLEKMDEEDDELSLVRKIKDTPPIQ